MGRSSRIKAARKTRRSLDAKVRAHAQLNPADLGAFKAVQRTAAELESDRPRAARRMLGVEATPNDRAYGARKRGQL
jgi:hypothetical protein